MHKKTFTLPTLTPKVSICPNGCLHLHLGSASVHITQEGLREFASAAEQLLNLANASPAPVVPEKDLH